MAERVYLIHVEAMGVTSGHTVEAKDLLDAVEQARKLQRAGTERISIVLSALPQSWQAEYRETFGV